MSLDREYLPKQRHRRVNLLEDGLHDIPRRPIQLNRADADRSYLHV
jgi:hypothetical protein